MKTIDQNIISLAEMQAKIFEESKNKLKCSSSIFIRRFMHSRYAERMDGEGFLFEATPYENAFEEIESEYGKTSYGKEKFSREELYWMGYIYRYWALLYNKTSKQVYRICNATELRKLFFPYHSLDPQAAIERILEAKCKQEEDPIKKGVRLLREIRKNNI